MPRQQNAFDALREIWDRSPDLDGWCVGDYLLMPDHVHLFARAMIGAKPLASWVGTWKSLSARRIITNLNLTSPIWQRDYFDRFLRDADNYSEKWGYVAMNPVRKGLCSKPDEWLWKSRMFDLSF